jgi:hypothetical protein
MALADWWFKAAHEDDAASGVESRTGTFIGDSMQFFLLPPLSVLHVCKEMLCHELSYKQVHS